ncbi:MAG: Flp pilus assembly complex ATPase component TadA [Lentisphaeria bacterium]|nr:Flp pilus assembly complex ATPase component TadA [Victivallales bacterium]MBR6058886.1 Flp pilus assembly complex ATPase component TadA [Victivallales bacterium]MCR4574041.1 Flp pilus assembly complex ATPase component TadA [Lentisphaeria bacterium]
MLDIDDFIVDLLVQQGLVDDEQMKEAKERAASEEGSTVLDALYSLKFISEQDVMQLLGAEYGMDTYDFDHASARVPAEVITLVPREVAFRYKVVPISFANGILRVAISDPTDIETIDSIRYLLKMEVEPVVSTKRQIEQALGSYYGSMEGDASTILEDMTEATTDLTVGATQDVTMDAKDKENGEDAAPIIRFVSLLILEAFRTRASDIHLEPLEKRFRLRYRIDGVLNQQKDPPKYLQNQILSRLKLMAGMDLSEHRIPQDGRIRITALGRDLDLRVSDIPANFGESIVMRILDKSGVMLGISELGFFEDDQQTIERIINFPDGIFLVTGPTGSGKTTSLYSFLHALNQPTRKIITAEDPVEYELSGINQVQINTDVNLTFAAALRSMLRQAPNVIMVGEIRDSETGEIAINAALTGHLVFSTLHTNDAPSAIPRLIDMGIKPFLVASSVRAIMAQRLLRRACKFCSQKHIPTELEADKLGLSKEAIENSTFVQGTGCSECNKGYKGRLGIYEIFILDSSIEGLIYEMADASVIRRRAMEIGMRTLRQDGMRKAAAGLSTLSEVIRITVNDEA